jgi:hypothetical protein
MVLGPSVDLLDRLVADRLTVVLALDGDPSILGCSDHIHSLVAGAPKNICVIA